MTDARLYEAADSLRASGARTFLTVTLPGVKYGLLSAVFVCFILAFTDFGAPKVVGGNYNVLATDIYKQVIGQQNFAMGATVSVILLIPRVIAFLLDRISQRRQFAAIQAKSVPLVPRPRPARDWISFAVCLLVALPILVFFFTAGFAPLVRIWPYDLTLSLRHYRFGNVGGGGDAALWTSLRMAAYSAAAGTVVTFVGAYLIEKGRGVSRFRQLAYFLSMLPLALPGMVVGLSYIFFFNAPGWTVYGLPIPNPLHALYGTVAILVACNVVHFYTVSFLTATTALKQLDQEFESVSESMAVPFHVTFCRVTVPVCLPAILAIGMYYFVNSMAALSAVIFLYSADLPLPTVAVANMDDAGDIAPAAAMAMLIVLANIGVRRDAVLEKPGYYRVKATDGEAATQVVTWEVYDTPGERQARNVILFIGDGLSIAHRTAARILAKDIAEGKYDGDLAMDMRNMALVGTSGVDSVITDSANSASAYATGHKSSVNAMGVYADRTPDTLDDPKVETSRTPRSRMPPRRP